MSEYRILIGKLDIGVYIGEVIGEYVQVAWCEEVISRRVFGRTYRQWCIVC